MNAARVVAAAACLAAAGCVSVSEGVRSLDEVAGDTVLVVGRIEIVPPIRVEEQSFKALDPFNTRRHHLGRAILFMSEQPQPRERTADALNPALEETYFLKLPRAKRYMVKGSVTMAFAMRTVSRRQAVTDQTELIFPAPIEFDIRPADKAIYVGTLRLHRDEFHEVTRVELRDDFRQAQAEFAKKFGPGVPLRKALLSPARR